MLIGQTIAGINPTTTTVYTPWFLRQGDDVVNSVEVIALSGSTQLVVTLDMAREPGHMLRVVVMPLALLVLLTFTVFWMDRESLGDRMDISFIGILSVVAYQIVLKNS